MRGSKSIARTVRHLQGPRRLAPCETLVQCREDLTQPSYEQVLSEIKPGYRTLRMAHFQATGSVHVRRIMAGNYLLRQLDATYRRFERDVQIQSALHAVGPDIAGKPEEWMDRRLIPFHRWDAISYPEPDLCAQLETMLVGMSGKGVFAAGHHLPLSPYWRWPISLLKERTLIAALLFGAPGEIAGSIANKPHLKGEKQLAQLYAPSPPHDGSLTPVRHPGAGKLVVRTAGGPDTKRLTEVIYETGYPFVLPGHATADVNDLTARLATFWWGDPAAHHDVVALNLQPGHNGRYQSLAFARTHWGSPLTLRF